jgi:hypothetical protein
MLNPYYQPRSSFIYGAKTEMPRPTTTYHEVRGTCIRESDKAFLFKPNYVSGSPVEGDRAAMWFPFSQIGDKFSLSGEQEHWFMGSEWILSQKELL